MAEGDALGSGGDGGAGGTSLTPAPPPPRWKALTEEGFESACMLAVRGVDVDTIAAVLREPAKRVERALRSRPGRKRLQELRGASVLRKIKYEEKLSSLLPHGAEAIEQGLRKAATVKNAADVGRWLHEAMVAKPAQKHEVDVSGRIEHDLSPVFERIAEGLRELKEAQRGRPDPLTRVMDGTQALAQRKVLTDGTS